MNPRDESNDPSAGGATGADVPTPEEVSAAKKRLTRDVVLFTVVRIALVLVLTGIIEGVGALVGTPIPLVVAFLIAVVLALPLSLVLFSGLRKRVNAGIDVVDSRRRSEKAQLHARLSGGGNDPRDDPHDPDRA